MTFNKAILMAVFFLALPLRADMTSKLEEMLVLSKQDEMLSAKGMKVILDRQVNLTAQQNPKDKKIYDSMKQTHDRLLSKIDFEDLKDKILSVYAKYYTEPEIDQVLAYYKSPIGKKSVEITPKIIAEIQKITAASMAKCIQEIQKEDQEKANKAKK